MDISALEKLISAPDLAEIKGCSADVVRNAARKGTIPGTVRILGRIAFDPDAALEWTPPAGKVTRRPDGRRRFYVYLLEEEFENLRDEGGFEVIDPRELRKARRAKTKATETVKTVTQDPFAEFGE